MDILGHGLLTWDLQRANITPNPQERRWGVGGYAERVYIHEEGLFLSAAGKIPQAPSIEAMAANTQHQSTAVLAARTALLALRGTLSPDRDAIPLQVSLPIGQVSDEVAATFLASLPKPLMCSARLQDRAVTIDCQPLSEQHRGAYQFESSGGPLEATAAAADASEGASVLLVSSHESMRVGADALRAFVHDYMILSERYRSEAGHLARKRGAWVQHGSSTSAT